MENKLLSLIDEFNNGKTNLNAIASCAGFYERAKDIKVAFYNKNSELYKKLLAFCADNGLIVISTNPATLSTIVRIEEQ